MANYVNGRVISINADLCEKPDKEYASRSKRGLHKSITVGNEVNYMFMNREQLCKRLNIK